MLSRKREDCVPRLLGLELLQQQPSIRDGIAAFENNKEMFRNNISLHRNKGLSTPGKIWEWVTLPNCFQVLLVTSVNRPSTFHFEFPFYPF